MQLIILKWGHIIICKKKPVVVVVLCCHLLAATLTWILTPFFLQVPSLEKRCNNTFVFYYRGGRGHLAKKIVVKGDSRRCRTPAHINYHVAAPWSSEMARQETDHHSFIIILCKRKRMTLDHMCAHLVYDVTAQTNPQMARDDFPMWRPRFHSPRTPTTVGALKDDGIK